MKKKAFMDIVNALKGFIRKVSGVPPLTLPNCVDDDSLISYSIEGNGVGDLTDDGKYKIPIKMSGKNLFDISKYIVKGSPEYEIADGKIVGSFDWGNCIQYEITGLNPNKKYTFSCRNMLKNNINIYIHKNQAFTHYGGDAEYVKYTFTPDNSGYIKVEFRNGQVNLFLSYDVQDIQIEEGEAVKEYEPYIEPQTTTIILDEPLTTGDILEYPKDNIPKLPTSKGTTIYTIETEVQPSNMSVEYYSTRKD